MDGSTNKGTEVAVMKRRLNTKEASAYTGIPVSTLRWFRCTSQGPIYSKPRGRCVYDVADLDAFLASGLRHPARASLEKRHVAV